MPHPVCGDPQFAAHSAPALVAEPPFQALTLNDGTWKCKFGEPPADGWNQIAFDDRDWLVLSQVEKPYLERTAQGYYQCARCVELGAVCLGWINPAEASQSWLHYVIHGPPPPVVDRVWIRKTFEIPSPEFHQS